MSTVTRQRCHGQIMAWSAAKLRSKFVLGAAVHPEYVSAAAHAWLERKILLFHLGILTFAHAQKLMSGWIYDASVWCNAPPMSYWSCFAKRSVVSGGPA